MSKQGNGKNGRNGKTPVLTEAEKAVVLGGKPETEPVSMGSVRELLSELADMKVCPAGVVRRTVPDSDYEQVLEVINKSIHELVFAAQFLEDDELEEAQNCLTTVGMNVDSIQDSLVSLEGK